MHRIRSPVKPRRQEKVHIPVPGERGRGCDCDEAGLGLHRHLRVNQLRGTPGVPQLLLQGSSTLNQWTVMDLSLKLFENFAADMLSGAALSDLFRLASQRLESWMVRGPVICVITGGVVNSVLRNEDLDVVKAVTKLHEKLRGHHPESFLSIALLTMPPRLRRSEQQSFRFEEIQSTISQIALPGFAALDMQDVGGRAAPVGNRFLSRPDARAFYEKPANRGLHLNVEFMCEILYRIKHHVIQLQ